MGSQNVSAPLLAGDSADASWPPRQVPPEDGAARCSRQNVSNLVRSAADANGTCVARFPQLGKHAPRSHHATQNSAPASLDGARLSLRTGRKPPGRTVMALNSASGRGFSTRETTVRGVPSVKADTPVENDATLELAAVALVAPLALEEGPPVVPSRGGGLRYCSGIGIMVF